MKAHLRVDWPMCEGRGLCHELAPELVDLDPWGYPIIGADVEAGTAEVAREAVAACPKRALRIVEA